MNTRETTRRKVLNYVARSVDTQELEEISRAASRRRDAVRDQERNAELVRQFEQLAASTVVVRKPDTHVITFGGSPGRLFSRDRWHVRKRHNGRKYVGLFVTETADEPVTRKSAVWLGLRDADMWAPERQLVVEEDR